MPTDPPSSTPPTDPPAADPPPAPPAPPPAVDREEVRTMVREALSEILGGGSAAGEVPSVDLSTDKKIEAFTEKIVREAMAELAAADPAGTPPPSSGTAPTGPPAPESTPENRKKIGEVIRAFVWGDS